MNSLQILVLVPAFLLAIILTWLVVGNRIRAQLSSQIEAARSAQGEAEKRSAGVHASLESMTTYLEQLKREQIELHQRVEQERAERVRAETRLSSVQEQLSSERELLREAESRLGQSFTVLAGEALERNSRTLLEKANQILRQSLTEAQGDLGKREEAIKGLVQPLTDSLTRFDAKVSQLEKGRVEGESALASQVVSLTESQKALREETGRLVSALRRPEVRGRWGEMTLRRVVELAGMSSHCDFTEQVSVNVIQGRQRPDMIIHLPGGREVIVDAKVSLDAYLDATNASSDEERSLAMQRHAEQVRDHVRNLAKKQYWDAIPEATDYVVMFIPGEAFFGAAVDARPDLIEEGLEKQVVIATPSTLIALLRAIAYGWRQQEVARNAREISDLGRELHERIGKLASYLEQIGAGITAAGKAYNDAVGSLERRVLPTARRFRDLGVGAPAQIPELTSLDWNQRRMIAPELQDDAS